ncbi:MAG: phosphatase PAP2 family protein [Saprospiraceae bacterium]|nr:phosphatase PAP2 family protein [Saprospiraceae bacterium]
MRNILILLRHCQRHLPTLFILVMLTTSADLISQSEHIGSGIHSADNQLAIDINHLTYTIANEHDQFYSFIGVRTLAMVHLAAHDIFNLQDRRYHPFYIHEVNDTPFDPQAAAIESTRLILTKCYPSRVDTINEVCDRWMATLDECLEKEKGKSTGQKVALKYLEYRTNDGHEKNGDYTPMTKPGDYQYTPGFDWVWIPDFSVARPFTLDSVAQFRSPPPPDLTSEVYVTSYQEVKDLGKKNSRKRTEDQTNFAHWWAEFGEHSWNRIGRITADAKGLPLVQTNRMFALLNVNLYDLYLASFDSKYYYDTWRPYTAIRHGEKDGNPQTQGDTTWEPEMQTPPWPEYPSAHAAVGAAGAEIVSAIFGTPYVRFSMESVTALPNSRYRRYQDLDKAAQDCADSRIMNGYHFRFATEEGMQQGRKIARHTLDHFLQLIEK